MANSTVTAFAVNSNGSSGSVLDSTTTDGSGNFTIQLASPASGPVRLTVSGGAFVSEMDGTTVNAPSNVSVLLSSGDSNLSGISVNPLTDFINSRTMTIASTSGNVPGALSQATGEIEQDYGLTSNPETLMPDYTAANANTDAGKLGLILGALIDEDEYLCPSAPGGLVAALSSDIADVRFDGLHSAGGSLIPYCGGNLPTIAGSGDFRDALSGSSQLQLVTAAFGFGGAYGPAGNILMSQTPVATPDMLLAPLASISSALASAAPDVNQSVSDLFGASRTATLGPNMVAAREGATATLLPNGQVLIAGGYVTPAPNSLTALQSTEIYSTTGNSFAASPPAMLEARAFHTATLLPNGNVLIAGPGASCELYQLASGTFASTGSMTFSRGLDTATLLPNGKVLIAGGDGAVASDNNPFDFHALASTDLYDPATGSFESAMLTPTMATHREQHTATLLPNGKVLIAGGFDNSTPNQFNILNTTEIYDPASNTFTPGPNMNSGRFEASAAVYANTKVVIFGGFVDAGGGTFTATSSVEIYDPATNSFAATTPAMHSPALPDAVLLPSGSILVVDNNALKTATEFYESPVEFNPEDFTDSPPKLNGARQGETVTLLPNGKVLIAGGLILTGSETKTTELISP